jgi:predicted MFS family arabinose efflux permease
VVRGHRSRPSQFSVAYPLHVLKVAPTFDFARWHFHDTQVYGLLLAWNGLMVVLLELPLTGWFLRFEPRRVIAAGYLLQGFGFALNAFCHDFVSLFASTTIFTLGEMAWAPMSSTFLAAISPTHMRGRYLGMLALPWSVSGVLGPLLGARLIVLHPNLLWGACGALGVAGAFTMLAVGRPPLTPSPVP